MDQKYVNFDLSSKVAIVTGGTRGIGEALALGLAQCGADVIPVSRTIEKAKAVSDRISAMGRKSFPTAVDVQDLKQVEDLRDKVLSKFGHIDILVNCAGVQIKKSALELTDDEFHQVIATNLEAVFRCCRVFGRQMVRQQSGKIINIASMTTFMGITRSSAYSSSKGGVGQLTKTLAIEWAKDGVNVNAIAPGFFKTDVTKPVQNDPAANARVLERTPLGRWGEVEELAGTCVFLASSASDFITGAIINVDGGFLAFGI